MARAENTVIGPEVNKLLIATAKKVTPKVLEITETIRVLVNVDRLATCWLNSTAGWVVASQAVTRT